MANGKSGSSPVTGRAGALLCKAWRLGCLVSTSGRCTDVEIDIALKVT
jgi:hypothetical protein